MKRIEIDELDYATVAGAIVSLLNKLALSGIEVEFNGEDILTNDETAADAIADFLEEVGFDYGKTSYYDPEEDARDGIHDSYTGKWAVSVD